MGRRESSLCWEDILCDGIEDGGVLVKQREVEGLLRIAQTKVF